jgi:hypothetical protein
VLTKGAVDGVSGWLRHLAGRLPSRGRSFEAVDDMIAETNDNEGRQEKNDGFSQMRGKEPFHRGAFVGRNMFD